MTDTFSATRGRYLRRLADRVRSAQAERDAVMLEAVEAGVSYREVAELVGVSHPTVMSICAKLRRPVGVPVDPQETQK